MKNPEIRYIRNFAIIAHVDHGKSTLADRLLELTGTICPELLKEQMLDSNPIERERGVTIKLAPVRMHYKLDGRDYILNLIDTPGHVDFSYEVSRSLAACEGVILLVDAVKGIQAQTVSHFQKASDLKLKIIPVINKIDLPQVRVEEVSEELMDLLSCKHDDILLLSAKTGQGVDRLLGEIINKIPPPAGSSERSLRGLVFSSSFDPYKGVICFVRLFDGKISSPLNDQLEFLISQAKFLPKEIGFFSPERISADELSAGSVGFIATGFKDISLSNVGDTIVKSADKKLFSILPLPGYKDPKPMVYQSIFPENSQNFPLLEDAVSKLKLSDSSLIFTRIESRALGRGLRCGFLGLFHAEIVAERLNVEYNQKVIMTIPNISFKVALKNREEIIISDPAKFDASNDELESVSEPFVKMEIFSPVSFIGKILDLCKERRGILVDTLFKGGSVEIIEEMPLSEVIFDFFDTLKSQTRGFASLDYEFLEYREAEIVKIDIRLNDELIDPLSMLVSKEKGEYLARRSVERLKELIPRQQFEVKIQAIMGTRIVASEKISPYRKDVTAKLYGGDRTRKDKLLEAQKKGKEKMSRIGNLEIPPDIFGKFLSDLS